MAKEWGWMMRKIWKPVLQRVRMEELKLYSSQGIKGI